jgi:hypothetical protein
VTERRLVFEDFADKVDEVFVIGQDGVPAIPLTLNEAELLNPAFAPPGVRPPFSLTFFARDPRILPQSRTLCSRRTRRNRPAPHRSSGE